ncbi:MAG: 4Fe-4S dicluster domain-containing protein [Clostridiales bacterium]
MTQDIIKKIKDAGVVGAGGAGFPSHVKLSAKVDVVVVNGAECEPLLRVDQQLMVVRADEMVKGLEIAVSVTEAKEGIIAIKGKHKEAIATLQKAIEGKDNLRIYILDDFYPAGDEPITLYESTGRLVPQGGIPSAVGAVVTNTETLINVSQAVEGIPVTDTYITLCGAVPKPVTVKVPVGISIREAFALAGVTNFEGYGFIDGGPMMGGLLTDIDAPVTKTAKGYIMLPKDHLLITKRELSVSTISRQAQAACIQCRFCTDMCPRFLLGHHIEPHLIMRALKYGEVAEETLRMAFACSECGMCEQYSCIGNISPRTVNANLKNALREKGIKPLDPPKDQQVNPNQKNRKVPSKRVVSRIGLTPYDRSAPLEDLKAVFTKVTIPLKQHVGAPPKPIVNVGQQVKRGEIIGEVPENALGAPIHASVDGVVEAITNQAIVIKVGGEN